MAHDLALVDGEGEELAVARRAVDQGPEALLMASEVTATAIGMTMLSSVSNRRHYRLTVLLLRPLAEPPYESQSPGGTGRLAPRRPP